MLYSIQMESDDLAPQIPRKRSRSPSLPSISDRTEDRAAATATTRAPKRLRRSHDIPDYNAPVEESVRRTMASANPLSRKVLKREAKKARRAVGKASKAQSMAQGGMDVDDDGGLAFTFMSGLTA